MNKWRLGWLVLLIGLRPALAAVNGEFLYPSVSGGITGVSANGTIFFEIFPQSMFGFQTTQNYAGGAQQFTQARTGNRIAFTSTHNGYLEGDLSTAAIPVTRIYMMNGDGTGIQQITFHDPSATDHLQDLRPAISPDGSQVAFIKGETVAPPGTISGNGYDCSGQETFGLWVMAADGTNQQLIRSVDWSSVSYCNAGSMVDAAWSPDGTKLLVRDTFGGCYGGEEVGIINADGSGYRQLVCVASSSFQSFNGLDWSPDGTKAAALIGPDPNGSYIVWDVTGATPVQIDSFDNTYGDAPVRFSPDSTQLAIATNNYSSNIVVVDLAGDVVSTLGTAPLSLNQGIGSLWWSSSSPGRALGNMTLGVPSIYVNACPNYTVQLSPSTNDKLGIEITGGFTGANVSVSGDGDSWFLDNFGEIQYSQGRDTASGTLQLTNFSATSNTVPLTVDPSCTCQANVGSQLTVTKGPLLYIARQQQYLQTLKVANRGSSPVTGPVNIAIEGLPSTVVLTNSSGTTGCTSSGSPYITAVPSGSLAAGASASVQLQFRDPQQASFTYSTAVVAGSGAP